MDLGLADDTALALANSPDIIWHQRFPLSASVDGPGVNDIARLVGLLDTPEDLSGLSVLDIGTTNGGAAFLAEARGAARVVAVDIYPPDRFGFGSLARALRSKAEFVRASIYELPEVLDERFDVVYFYGVLYHLRHPLLAIDSLYRLCRGVLGVETAICPPIARAAHAEFYPEELLNDSSNWFIPSLSCARDWFSSSGFTVESASSWPEDSPGRAFLQCRPVPTAAYESNSYEVPLRVVTGETPQNAGTRRSYPGSSPPA
jgi:tRNA (mo5U34)-methyltransferase